MIKSNELCGTEAISDDKDEEADVDTFLVNDTDSGKDRRDDNETEEPKGTVDDDGNDGDDESGDRGTRLKA